MYEYNNKCLWSADCLNPPKCRLLCISHYEMAGRQGRLDEFPVRPRVDPELRRKRNCEFARRRYHANIEEARKISRDKVAVVRVERLAWINEYKLSHGCVDCGYNAHPAALAFDHIDPKTKLFGIAKGLTYSVEKILAEIAKCEVRCANCHTVRSVNEGHLGRPRKTTELLGGVA